MITQEQIRTVLDQDVYDANGEKIGEVKHVYLDDATGRPEWLCVKTGLFGMRETFVPVQAADVVADHVEVAYDKDRVKAAPNVDVDAGGHLSAEEERELYRYYGIDWADSWRQANQPGESGWAHSGGARERERLGRGDEAMTRSEEQLTVGTEAHEAGRARLRKYVVTEEQQVSVPVTREEVRVEREPITDANRDAALAGPDISEAEHEVVLHEERPVVDKQAVPVERVRLGKERVTEQETVSGQVRKERIDVDGGTDGDMDDSRRAF
ncbi:photosystem reaction center subunit H [Planomonospora sphaerica]|uniref:Photosystem reaction center subunit H n=1 Tax=Planomonospora sphaerica TaxID=161355 RepID=A0A161MC05_9ACTN|nr:PRC and DUF2382 domain-containing protein [Planomonospora sphaerica]GAT68593.1 photosystem reaction center subunit H [Planomonospora sphaerica]